MWKFCFSVFQFSVFSIFSLFVTFGPLKGENGILLGFFLFFLHYHPFPLFLFMFCHSWQSLFLFLGASIVCVNLKRAADLVFWFPDRTSDCTHPWHQNDLIVFTEPLNLTKLSCYMYFCLSTDTWSGPLLSPGDDTEARNAVNSRSQITIPWQPCKEGENL